jgi:hypothetical protein
MDAKWLSHLLTGLKPKMFYLSFTMFCGCVGNFKKRLKLFRIGLLLPLSKIISLIWIKSIEVRGSFC